MFMEFVLHMATEPLLRPVAKYCCYEESFEAVISAIFFRILVFLKVGF